MDREKVAPVIPSSFTERQPNRISQFLNGDGPLTNEEIRIISSFHSPQAARVWLRTNRQSLLGRMFTTRPR